MVVAILICGLFLAYANGANDNFKGVATLYGSGVASYKTSLIYSTMATIAGSLSSIFVARGLIAIFSGKGLVPDAIVSTPSFALAVALAAALTVMLATRLGYPISTTHALTGALAGTGLMAANGNIAFIKLGSAFFLPLILSPFVSLILAYVFYPLVAKLAPADSCLCVTERPVLVDVNTATTSSAFVIADQKSCATEGSTTILNFNSTKILDALHFLSAGLVCFARGLNDTPKLAALLIMVPFLSTETIIIPIAASMAIGGVIHSRRIAETMSHKVTTMNSKQGFAANFITAVVVNTGSRLNLPVSTTHASCGTLFGIGLQTKSANWTTIKHILTAWVVTLPTAAIFGYFFYNLILRIVS
ncbi:MAG: inorganic phosphate transporter [Bacteriovorax sp.]|jgi:PiT family inorganic phosphate transporter